MAANLSTPKVQSALALAASGFSVFPVQPDTKVPKTGLKWKEAATTHPNTISRWWRENPDYNIGVAAGKGLLVLDVDIKHGKQGLDSLVMLDMLGLPDSVRVQTPSGGLHVYLRSDRPFSNRVGTIPNYPGLDIRTDGGYVLGPGSTIDGKPYSVTGRPVSNDNIEPAEAWLCDILAKGATASVERKDVALVEPDLPGNVAKAIHYLEHQAPEAVQGAGGDTTTFSIAAELRAFGVSESLALELMLEHWNETKASPPWNPDELQVKVANGYNHGQGAFGGKTAAAEFGEVEIDIGEPPKTDLRPQPATHRSKLKTVSVAEAMRLALSAGAEPLIDGLLDCNTVAMIYGDSNTGKSFVALDMAAAIATGRPWNGRATTQGAVLYIAAEGGNSIYRRVLALVDGVGLPEAAPLGVLARSVDLCKSDADLSVVIARMREMEAQYGVPCRMAVFDTLNRVMAGGDENSNVDMGMLISNFDKIRDATGATVVAIHHNGKDATRGARGHSSLRAAIDTEFRVDAAKGHTLTNTKQRDEEMGPVLDFRLEKVELGLDARGRAVSSCVVRFRDTAEFGPIPLSQIQERFLEALGTVMDPATGASLDEWANAYRRQIDPQWSEGSDLPSGTSDKNLRTLRKELIDCGHVKELPNKRFKPISN